MTFYREETLAEWETGAWFNTPSPLTLAGLRGSVVVICAFQILCQGCKELALPQAQRVHHAYSGRGVAVVGLHTVFEAHAKMGDTALEAFLRENGYTFPVGVDAPGALWMPRTMEKYGIEGTPSLVLVDREGRRRFQRLGHLEDDQLLPMIASLLGGAAVS